MNIHISLTHSPMPSVCEQPSIRQLSYLYQSQSENISRVACLAKSIEACGTIKRWHWRFFVRKCTIWGSSHWLWLISPMMTKILSRYDELFFWWHLVLRSYTQSFARDFQAWTTVSGQPKLWPLYGFSISIDFDFEDVRLLLVSPLAEGNLTSLSRDIFRDKNQIATFVSAFTLRHIHCSL